MKNNYEFTLNSENGYDCHVWKDGNNHKRQLIGQIFYIGSHGNPRGHNILINNISRYLPLTFEESKEYVIRNYNEIKAEETK